MDLFAAKIYSEKRKYKKDDLFIPQKEGYTQQKFSSDIFSLNYSYKSERNRLESSCYENSVYLILFTGRIDNREFFSIREEDNSAQIMLDRFLTKGTDLFAEIIGDWQIFIWNKLDKSLYTARDHTGMGNVFYLQRGREFYFASSLSLLVSIIPEPELNEEYMVLYLIGQGVMRLSSVNPYKNVQELKPGSYLEIRDSLLNVKRYWNLEDSKNNKLRNEDEYTEAFREIYQRAVNRRLRGSIKPGVTLSGGLDSSSVAVLMAENLAVQGRELFSFTSVPQYYTEDSETQFFDESGYVKEICNMYKNIRPSFLNCKNTSLLEPVSRLNKICSAPVKNGGNAFWIEEIFKRASESGIDTIFLGQGGNSTVSFKIGAPLLNLLFNFRLKDMLRELSILKEQRACSAAGIIKRELLAPYLKRTRNRMYRFLPGAGGFMKKCIITGEFLDNSGLKEKVIRMRYQRRVLLESSTQVNRFNFINPRFCNGSKLWTEIGMHYNIKVSDPTLDKDLVEFVYHLPDDLIYKDGINKRIFKSAMRGILPDNVLYNKKKGRQSADLHKRAEYNIQEIEQFILKAGSDPYISSIINVKQMDVILKRSIKEETAGRTGNFMKIASLIDFIFQNRDK